MLAYKNHERNVCVLDNCHNAETEKENLVIAVIQKNFVDYYKDC